MRQLKLNLNLHKQLSSCNPTLDISYEEPTKQAAQHHGSISAAPRLYKRKTGTDYVSGPAIEVTM